MKQIFCTLTSLRKLPYLCIYILFSCLLLTTIVFDKSELIEDTVQKSAYIHFITPIWATYCFLFILLKYKRLKIQFNYSDILVIAFFGLTLITYDYQLNPAIERLLLSIQLIICWFSLRILLTNIPHLKRNFLLLIVLIGIVEVIMGFLQLYNIKASNHNLFAVTGHFSNPGPYSGFITTIYPIALCLYINLKKTKMKSCIESLQYNIGWYYVILALLILSFTHSRTSYAALLVSSLIILIYNTNLPSVIKSFFKNKPLKSSLWIMFIMIIFCAFIYYLYIFKKESADGRFLIWKISLLITLHNNFTGVGLGKFPSEYASMQAKYFSSENSSLQDQLIAGTPQYCFNDLLQISIELGFIGLILFLLLLGYSIHNGFTKGKIGETTSLLTLFIFSFASYPLQLPEFKLLLVILLACINSDRKCKYFILTSASSLVIIGVFIFLSIYTKNENHKYYDAHIKWREGRKLYYLKNYSLAKDEYKQIKQTLSHNPEYLLELAQCLRYTEEPIEALSILHRASRLCSNPMPLYIQASILQSVGRYNEAEQILIHSINVLPHRIYPYYLLANLYSDSAYVNVYKLKEVSRIILYKKQKIENSATRQIRENTKVLLEKNNIKDI